MKWIQYTIDTTTKHSGVIGECLSEFGILGFEISDNVPLSPEEEAKMYTDIPAELPEDDGTAKITFYTGVPGEESDYFSTGSSLRDQEMEDDSTDVVPPEILIPSIKERIKSMQKYSDIQVPTIKWEIQDDSLWKDKWKENFKPIHIADDIIVKPTWEEIPEDAKDTDLILSIDPGSAFGTGTHETTKLCLLSLREYIEKDTRIMDAGCGSGILAIAALLCGAHSAFCLDIDDAAVSGAIENAEINNIPANRFKAVKANILEDKESLLKQTGGQFDIVVANILADVIVLLTDHVGTFLKPGGIFISSGILAEKADEVQQAIEKSNFKIIKKNEMGDWVSFVATKK